MHEWINDIEFDIWRFIAQVFPEDRRITYGVSLDDLAAIVSGAMTHIYNDYFAYLSRDPAARGEGKQSDFVPKTYLCFKAISYHRLAHATLMSNDLPASLNIYLSRQMSELTRTLTHIEIHPGAKIGERFVIDHGDGVVIGEQAIIGDDCYILQGVVLGSRDVSGDPAKAVPHGHRRHPKLGNNVVVSSFAKILGGITIDDDVTVGPHSLIMFDIRRPVERKVGRITVAIVNQLQLTFPNERELEIYGISPIPKLPGLKVHAHGFAKPEASFVDLYGCELPAVELEVTDLADTFFDLRIRGLAALSDALPSRPYLRLREGDDAVYILDAIALKRLIRSQKGALS